MKKLKGFTLIELLVVIAIIGILAAIVLVSLTGARKKAYDVRITAGMGQIRTTAEIIKDTDGDYDNVCLVGSCGTGAVPSSDIATIAADINSQNAAGQSDLTIFRDSSGVGSTAYCAYIQMNTNYWCVDSTLISKTYTNVPTCTAADFTCN